MKTIVRKVDAAIQSALERDTKYEVEFASSPEGIKRGSVVGRNRPCLKGQRRQSVTHDRCAVDVTERRRAERLLRNTEN